MSTAPQLGSVRHRVPPTLRITLGPLLRSRIVPFVAGLLVVASGLSMGAVPVRASTDGTWTEFGPAPRERSKHAAVYDSHRQRMILFGGRCQDACCPNGPVGDDVWMLTLAADVPQWVQVRPAGVSPGAGLGPAGIYDPVRDRMLVPGASGRVWELALAGAPQWNELTLTGTGPSPTAPTAVYDPVRDQMVVVTGSGAWTLSLGGVLQWTKLAPAGRAPTGVLSAVYDPVRDRVVVFGDSTRVLSLGGSPAWSLLTNNRMPRGHTSIYDPVRDRVVLHGGCQGTACGTTETWVLSLQGTPAWTLLSNTGPLASYHSAVYDPAHDRMVVFGGYVYQFYNDWSLRELWSLSFAGSPQWQDLTTPDPPRACANAPVLDAAHGRVIVFDDSLRALDLVGLPNWSTLRPGGSAPDPRQDYAAIADPSRGRLLLFGGWVWSGTDRQPLADLWALSLASPEAWTQLSPGGTPPATYGPAVYDVARDRLLLIGAQRVWELRLAEPMSWNELAPAGAPPPVDSGFAAVYDPVRDRVVVFGGGGVDGLTNGVWELVLAPAPAWNPLAPTGTAPAARAGAMAVYDPVRDRLIVSGGDTGDTSPATDTWALTLASPPAWLPLATTGASDGGTAAFYEPTRDRMVTLGTCAVAAVPTCPDPSPGVWALWFSSVLDVSAAPAIGRLSLAQSRPNPARGSAVISFMVARPGTVRLRVYDVSGRAIRTLFDGPLAGGEHAVRWDGLRGDGAPARTGAYFYELSSGGERVARRLLLLR